MDQYRVGEIAVNGTGGNTIPDARWPVAARNLLTARERSLFELLTTLYPHHKLFVQVALSQLIDVPTNHPERQSIRNRFSQLVLDFVLCGADLRIVAVIELDDASHERPDRQDADSRKTKALTDAGLRLVRIPAGRLPPAETLGDMINGDQTSDARAFTPRLYPVESSLPELQLAEDWGSSKSDSRRMDHELAASRAVRINVLKVLLGGIVVVGGWFAYTQIVPLMVQRALQPLASQSRPVVPTLPPRPEIRSTEVRQSVPVASGMTSHDLVEKNRAWAAYYSAPTSCEHPVDWKAQVECGNQYMRAKNEFEKQWSAEQGNAQTRAPVVVLDNVSISASRTN